MGIVTVSGEAGCRFDEVARLTAQRLGFSLLTQTQIDAHVARDFPDRLIPPRALADVTASIVAQLALDQHLVVAADGVEAAFRGFPDALSVRVTAPAAARAGNVMLDQRCDRTTARAMLRETELLQKAARRARTGRASAVAEEFDLVLNTGRLSTDDAAAIIDAAVRAREWSLLAPAAEAQLQFQIRLRLARHRIALPSSATLSRREFAHPSEEIFANLLDFYRIPWEYEPRSFPVQWDADGRVTEAFTPDFYLPEFDLYVELTTMKQSLVTKKNRKVKRLRELHPNINIQVFYQKDFENLIFKHGLAGRLVTA